MLLESQGRGGRGARLGRGLSSPCRRILPSLSRRILAMPDSAKNKKSI